MPKKVVAVRFYKENLGLQKIYKGKFAIFAYGGVVVNALIQIPVLLLCDLCVLWSENNYRCSNRDCTANCFLIINQGVLPMLYVAKFPTKINNILQLKFG